MKRSERALACDLYVSDLFKKSRVYIEEMVARGSLDRWYILSAKYFLVHPKSAIEPYDLTLNTMSKAKREKWADKVLAHLQIKCEQWKVSCLEEVEFTALAGKKYIEPLRRRGARIFCPLDGLSIGERLHWLTEHSTALV